MVKIKNPTDLLIKANALKILWNLYIATRDNTTMSGSKMAKDIGIDNCHALNYLKRWHENKLVNVLAMDGGFGYFSLNPDMFNVGPKELTFEVNGFKISIEELE